MSVLYAQLYEPDRPFDGMVSALWQARTKAAAAGSGAVAECVKLLMNSLIGKLAAREHSWIDEPLPCPLGPWQAWPHYGEDGSLKGKYRTIGWHAQRLVEGGETRESCPALASWIYSTGRCRLLDWMRSAGKDEVHYVDSDCLLCTAIARDRLERSHGIDSGEMGALRVQGVYQTLRIGGIRDYQTAGRKVQAGVSPTLRDNGRGRWVGWQRETVRQSVHAGHAPELVARHVSIPVFRAYRHGTVGADGKVSPLEV